MSNQSEPKSKNSLKNPLVEVYGEKALDIAFNKIQDLRENSNFVFDMDYINMGISFIHIKSQEILDGKRKKVKLESLISESFGEAAIFKFNIKK